MDESNAQLHETFEAGNYSFPTRVTITHVLQGHTLFYVVRKERKARLGRRMVEVVWNESGGGGEGEGEVYQKSIICSTLNTQCLKITFMSDTISNKVYLQVTLLNIYSFDWRKQEYS